MRVGASRGVKKKASNWWLLVILVILLMTIVGLIVAIIYLKNNNVELEWGDSNIDHGVLEYMIEQKQVAIEENTAAANEILDRLENEDDYTVQDANEDFRSAIADNEGKKRFYLEIAYASFLYDYYEDLERAVAVLDGMANSVEDDWKSDYYATYANLYYRAGQDEKAREYRLKMIGGSDGESD